MKLAIVFALGFALTVSAAADESSTRSAPPPAGGKPTLAVVVLDALPRVGHYDGFNFIAEEFGHAFEARHWPVGVEFERFAANTEDHAIELKLYDQGIRNDFNFAEQHLLIWVILEINGAKHDFGIVDFKYYPRAGEREDDVIHRMYRGVGEKVAQRIEPFLVPPSSKK